jgi:hypothetical protein
MTTSVLAFAGGYLLGGGLSQLMRFSQRRRATP